MPVRRGEKNRPLVRAATEKSSIESKAYKAIEPFFVIQGDDLTVRAEKNLLLLV